MRLIVVLSAVWMFLPSLTSAQDVSAPPASDAKGIGSYTMEKARVEEVLRVEDDNYKSVIYVVTWKGSRIGVEDPLSQSTHQVGDTIKFMVNRWHPADKPEPRALHFTLLDAPRPKR